MIILIIKNDHTMRLCSFLHKVHCAASCASYILANWLVGYFNFTSSTSEILHVWGLFLCGLWNFILFLNIFLVFWLLMLSFLIIIQWNTLTDSSAWVTSELIWMFWNKLISVASSAYSFSKNYIKITLIKQELSKFFHHRCLPSDNNYHSSLFYQGKLEFSYLIHFFVKNFDHSSQCHKGLPYVFFNFKDCSRNDHVHFHSQLHFSSLKCKMVVAQKFHQSLFLRAFGVHFWFFWSSLECDYTVKCIIMYD